VNTDAFAIVRPYLPRLVWAGGYLGFGGLTLTISLALDVLLLFTFPTTLSYHILRAVLKFQISTLSSLWNLFRGMLLCRCMKEPRELILGVVRE
jgi:hypothetical protein